MNIREATSQDASAIAVLVGELGYEADAGALAARLDRLAQRSDNRVIVAILDGKIVGWAQAAASEVLESGSRVEIVGLVVTAAYRRRGWAGRWCRIWKPGLPRLGRARSW